jgi:hypothetical protein
MSIAELQACNFWQLADFYQVLVRAARIDI